MSNPNPYDSGLLAALGNPTGYGGGLLASLWRRLTEEQQQMGPTRFREMLRNSPEARNQPHAPPSGLPRPVRGDATVANERHAPAPQRQTTVGPLDRHAQETGRQDELRKERRQHTYEAIPQPVRGAMNAYEGAVGVLPGRVGEAARALPVALGHEVAGGDFDLNEAAGEQGGLDRSTPDRAMQLLGAFYGYGKLLHGAGTVATGLGEATGFTSPLARLGFAHAAQAAVDASQHAESGEERVRNVLLGQAMSLPFSAGALKGVMREAPEVALSNSRRITGSMEPARRDPTAFGRDLGGIQRRADASGGTVNVQGKPVGDGLNPNVRPDLTASRPEPQSVVGRMRADAERIVSRGTPVVEHPATPETLRAAVDRIPPAPEQRVSRVAPMSQDVGVEDFRRRTMGTAPYRAVAGLGSTAAGAAGGAAVDEDNPVRGAIVGGVLGGAAGVGAGNLIERAGERGAVRRSTPRYPESTDAVTLTPEMVESSAVLRHRFNPSLTATIEHDPKTGGYAIMEHGGTLPRRLSGPTDLESAGRFARQMGFAVEAAEHAPMPREAVEHAVDASEAGRTRLVSGDLVGLRGPEPTPQARRTHEPLPVPPVHPDIDPAKVAPAWRAASARYPRLASMVRGIEPLPPEFQGRAGGAWDPQLRALKLDASAEASEELVFAELAHVAQTARGKLHGFGEVDPETLAELEDFSARVQGAYVRATKGGPEPSDMLDRIIYRSVAGVVGGGAAGAATSPDDRVGGAARGAVLGGLLAGLIPELPAAFREGGALRNNRGVAGPHEPGQPIRRRDLPGSMRTIPKDMPLPEQNAWIQGERAGNFRLSRDVNPFEPDTPEWTRWEQGWRSQQPRQRGAEFGLNETPQEPERAVMPSVLFSDGNRFDAPEGHHGIALEKARQFYGFPDEAEMDLYGPTWTSGAVTNRGRFVPDRAEISRMHGLPQSHATSENLAAAGVPGFRAREDLPVTPETVGDPSPTPASPLDRLAEPVRNERGAVGPLSGTRVADEAGEPRVVYHGTSRAFHDFDENLSDPKALYGPGFYFTEDATKAGGDGALGGYAKTTAHRPLPGDVAPNIRPARLGIRRPFDVDAEIDGVEGLSPEAEHILKTAERELPEYDWDYAREQLDALAEQENISGNRLYRVLERTVNEDGVPLGRPAVNDLLRRAGYDGITHLGGEGSHRVWIAFERPQIRSAFGSADEAAQAGASNIAPLTSIVGGGAGAAYGYTQGDTQEERALNALAYGAGGAVAGGLLPGALVSAARHAGNEVGAVGVERPRRFTVEPAERGRFRVVDSQTGQVVEEVGGVGGQRTAEALARRFETERQTAPQSAGPLAGTRVVDGSGEPRTVYHGTSRAFEDFDPTQLDPEAQYGPGFYFTEDAGVASGYTTKGQNGARIWSPEELRARIAERESNLADPTISDYARRKLEEYQQSDREYLAVHERFGPNVRPARLAIQNPFDMDARVDEPALRRLWDASGAEHAETFENATAGFRRSGKLRALTGEEAYEWLSRRVLTGDRAAANRVLQTEGYDGITHIGGGNTGTDPHRVWIAFDRSQIRSAFGPAEDAAQAGAASGAAVRAIGGASAGAVVGAAADDEDRARGAAVGAVAGLGVGLAPEVLRGVRNASYAKAVTLWKAGLLTALRTHEVNIASNVANAVGETVKDTPAAMGDRVLTAVINNGAVRRTLGIGRRPVGEAGGQTALDVAGDAPMLRRTKSRGQSFPVIAGGAAGAVAGATQGDTPGERARNALVGLAAGSTAALAAVSGRGAREGVRAAREVVMGKRPSSSLARFEVPADQEFTNPFLRAYTNTVFRSLGAEDQLFRSVALHRSLQEQAQTAAMNEGLRGPAAKARARSLYDSLTGRRAPDAGDAQTLDAIALRAAGDAEVATFQDRTHVGDALTALGKIPVLGPVVAPFGKTPGAVATRIVEYTPAGYVISAVQVGRLVSALKAGASPAEVEAIQRYASETFGRATTGTGIIGLGYVLGRLGMTTGAYPENAAERQRWQLEGTQEGSVKLGGTWHEFSRLAPFGNLLSIGTNVAAMERRGDGSGLVARALAATGQGISDQPFLQGVEQFNGARKQPFGGTAERYVRSEAASVVPAGIAAFARATDPVVRQPDTVGQAVMARIPWLSRRVPAKVDALGREVRRSGGALGEFLPLRQSADKTETDPLVRMLADLNVSIAPLQKHRGESGEAYRQRQRVVGHYVGEILTTVSGDAEPQEGFPFAQQWQDFRATTPEAARQALDADPELREAWHNDAAALARATRASIVSGVQERVKSEYSTARREALAALRTARRTTANPNTLRRQFNDQLTSGVLLDADFGTVQH